MYVKYFNYVYNFSVKSPTKNKCARIICVILPTKLFYFREQLFFFVAVGENSLCSQSHSLAVMHRACCMAVFHKAWQCQTV